MLLPVLFSNYFIFKLLFHFLFLVLPRNNVINMNKVLYNTLISKGLPPPICMFIRPLHYFASSLTQFLLKRIFFLNTISISFQRVLNAFYTPFYFAGAIFICTIFQNPIHLLTQKLIIYEVQINNAFPRPCNCGRSI